MLIICKQCFKKYNFQFNLNFKYILHVIVYLNTYTKKKKYIEYFNRTWRNKLEYYIYVYNSFLQLNDLQYLLTQYIYQFQQCWQLYLDWNLNRLLSKNKNRIILKRKLLPLKFKFFAWLISKYLFHFYASFL